MSTSGGSAKFSLPYHLDPPWIDGSTMNDIPGPIEREPSFGANVLIAFSGTATVQLDYRGGDHPETFQHFQWPIEVQAGVEADWYLLGKLARKGWPVYFIDFGPEQEVFVAGVELTDFILPRPTAKSIMTGFPSGVYPVQAFLNEVAQTVIESGSPSAGEVKVVGAAVTAPTLSDGDELEIRYVPAYSVVVSDLGDSYDDYNNKVREYLVIEARGAVAP